MIKVDPYFYYLTQSSITFIPGTYYNIVALQSTLI